MYIVIKILIVWLLTFVILLVADRLLSIKDKNKKLNKHYYKFIFFFATLMVILNYITYFVSSELMKFIVK